MKKGRHRRFEEARALKRSQEVDLNDLFEDISDSDEGSTSLNTTRGQIWPKNGIRKPSRQMTLSSRPRSTSLSRSR